jgi:hypothetical protein
MNRIIRGIVSRSSRAHLSPVARILIVNSNY